MAMSTLLFFFFNDTATTEIYTLSLHDALPISAATGAASRPRRARTRRSSGPATPGRRRCRWPTPRAARGVGHRHRSEEHTSELQSQSKIVCRLLPGKKKKTNTTAHNYAYTPRL